MKKNLRIISAILAAVISATAGCSSNTAQTNPTVEDSSMSITESVISTNDTTQAPEDTKSEITAESSASATEETEKENTSETAESTTEMETTATTTKKQDSDATSAPAQTTNKVSSSISSTKPGTITTATTKRQNNSPAPVTTTTKKQNTTPATSTAKSTTTKKQSTPAPVTSTTKKQNTPPSTTTTTKKQTSPAPSDREIWDSMSATEKRAYNEHFAERIAYYISVYRGNTEIVYLPGLANYAYERSNQTAKLGADHDVNKRNALAEELKYGFYFTKNTRYYGNANYNVGWNMPSASEALISGKGYVGSTDAEIEKAAENVVKSFKDSSSHWKYLGNSSFKYIGVGCGDGSIIVTAM